VGPNWPRGGTGWGPGASAAPGWDWTPRWGTVPELTSDMIFVGIGTEMGMIGAAAVVFAFVLLMGAGLRIAQAARTDFSASWPRG